MVTRKAHKHFAKVRGIPLARRRGTSNLCVGSLTIATRKVLAPIIRTLGRMRLATLVTSAVSLDFDS